MKLFPAVLLLALATSMAFAQAPFRGRGGPDRAPAEGAKIPKVSAKSPDGETTVELNKPKRLTVLVFGSHT